MLLLSLLTTLLLLQGDHLLVSSLPVTPPLYPPPPAYPPGYPSPPAPAYPPGHPPSPVQGEDPLGLDGQAEMAEVADPAIMRAAAVAISHLNNGEFSDLNLMTPLELTTITTATKQAVNEGVLYMVSLRVSDFRAASVTIKCMVWSRPWLASSPNPEMADILYKAEISIQLPVRRISGGVAPLSTDNPSVLIAMEEALSMINQGAYSEIVDSLALQLPLTLVGVSSAQTQIV